MKELFEKISSYNIFNFLFPGILFAFFADYLTNFKLIVEGVLESFFLYYFLGLVISRVGSLVIEPILKRMNVVFYSDYDTFIKASNTDKKLELFSEVNNTYRTIISLLFLTIATLGIDKLLSTITISTIWFHLLLLALLTLLFVFSYRKQSSYIRKRVDFIKKRELIQYKDPKEH